MHLTSIIFGLLASTALASEVVYTDATSFGAMLARGEAIAKRQGYTPEQSTCGLGRNCQEACGPSHVQCPSTDNRIHCHNPLTGTHCCTDGSGKACRAGYYCTTDGRGNTYCCPDNIQNAECARLYSLTISLIRETSRTVIPSASGVSSSLPVFTPVLSTSSRIHVSSARTSASSSIRASASRNSTSLLLPSIRPNATSTRSRLPEFTGGAVKLAGAGMAVLMGAAGMVL